MGRLLVSTLLFSSTFVLGYAESSISGKVSDLTGAPLPDSQVTIRNVETGSTRAIVADQSGNYNAPSLPIGGYEVAASKVGFTSETKTGISLVIGEHAVVDLTLTVGELKQTVTVEESAAVVSVSTQNTSGLVGEKQVKELPLNGRSYDGLVQLNPGVVNYTSQRAGGIGTSNSAMGNMFAVSGHRPQENVFLLNGIEYTSASEINLSPGGASGQLLGVDAVREFNVLTDTYGAEYGKRPGAQVTIVTASGGNQFHGAAYEFLRNSKLDARNFFDQASVPQFQRNVFGGAAGGALRKDKTFVFGNYEGFRQHLGLSDVTLVPDNNARAGYLPDSNGKLVNVGLGAGVKELLALWPVQNGPSLGGGIAEAFSHPLQTIREDFGTTRADHILSSKDTIFGVYTVDDSFDHTPTVNPLSYNLEGLRAQVASLEETHVFSAAALNTARFGFSRAKFYFTGETTVAAPGFIAGAPVGTIVIGGSTASNAASQISLAGNNAGSNLHAARNLFTFEDVVSLTHGVHRLDAGVWLQRIQANDSFAQAQWGQASFASLTGLLQGVVSTFTAVPNPTPMGWRSLEGAWFVQDTIRVRPNLEIRTGFRAESSNGWNEVNHRAANYFFHNGVIDSQPHVGASVLEVNRAKFLPEPRVGVSWDPLGHGTTVIRAGFGLYHNMLDNLSFRLDQNAPFNTTISLKNVPVSNLGIVPGAPLPSGGKISPAGVQPDLHTATVESYTLRIEQKLPGGTALAIGYTGSHGYHEILAVDANLPVPAIVNGVSYFAPGSPLANPSLANTTSWFSEGVSSYNALDVDVNRRFSHGLQFRGVYTWSKSLDDGATLNSSVATNAPGFVSDPLHPKVDYSLSTFDVRHLAVVNATWELPFGRGKLLGGWTVSGIETVQTGFPFTPQLGFNPSNNGDTRNPVRPSWNPAFRGKLVLGGVSRYFDPNAFIAPANGTYGNVGRDTIIGPGLTTFDFSAAKRFPIRERANLQFRAEFFNILNHSNFTTPNPVVLSSATSGPAPTAGVITATSTASRQIQFGLKLLW